MYYEKLAALNMDRSNPKNVLVVMGYLSEDDKQLACWCGNANTKLINPETDFMLPNRFWVSIKDDMLYICKSSLSRKVLSYYANIEIKNMKYINKETYTFPSYVFTVNNELGQFIFSINPYTVDEVYYAETIVEYIVEYNKKRGIENDL